MAVEMILDGDAIHNAINKYIQEEFSSNLKVVEVKMNWVKGGENNFKATVKVETIKPDH